MEPTSVLSVIFTMITEAKSTFMVLGTEEIYNWRRVLFLSQEAGRVDAVEELADGEDCGTINIQLLQKLEAITVRLGGPHARDS